MNDNLFLFGDVDSVIGDKEGIISDKKEFCVVIEYIVVINIDFN